MYQTIGYLNIPNFYLQLHHLYYPNKKQEIMVVGGSAKEHGIIMEASDKAMEKGIRADMLTLDAFQQCPEMKIILPDEKKYTDYLEKIWFLLEKFSLKNIQETYHSFFLFFPRYFNILNTLKELQNLIRSKWHLQTRIGLSPNKYMARLAGTVCPVNQIMLIDHKNANELLSHIRIEEIPELNTGDIQILKMAGIQTVHDVLNLNLHELKFFLQNKAHLLYYNYVVQLKTIQEENFIFKEIIFYQTQNDLQLIFGQVKELLQKIFINLSTRWQTINKIKLYVEYIDNINCTFTKKLPSTQSYPDLIQLLSSTFHKLTRRVRIKKIGLYTFYSQYKQNDLAHIQAFAM